MISSKHAKQIIRSNADFAKKKRAERAYNALIATRINHKAPHAHHSGTIPIEAESRTEDVRVLRNDRSDTMNIETLERANSLKKSIDHYKWQLKYAERLAESDVEITLSAKSGNCNIVEVPGKDAKQFIIEYIGMKYTSLLSEAEKEFEEL